MNPEIHEQKKFLRNITKDYIDLQDSNQENNEVEQILSKEELNIKLQGLLRPNKNPNPDLTRTTHIRRSL